MNLWTARRQRARPLRIPQAALPWRGARAVVLAFDVRQFEDKRKVYNPPLPNPVLHLSSREFCQHAAGVYAAHAACSR